MALNYVKKQNAHIIGHDYGFFPFDDIRFEVDEPEPDENWGFFANRSNRTQIHIKYNPHELKE